MADRDGYIWDDSTSSWVKDRSFFRNTLQGDAEALATIASSAVLEPVAGYAGLLGAALPGEPGQGARWTENVRDLAYEAQDTSTLEQLGSALEKPTEMYHQVMRPAEQWVEENFGTGAAVAFGALPQAVAEVSAAAPLMRGAGATTRATGEIAAQVADAAKEVPAPSRSFSTSPITRGIDEPDMSARILETLGPPKPDAPHRVKGDMPAPAELSQLGYNLRESDINALNASSYDELAAADNLRLKEAYLANDPWTGKPQAAVLEQRENLFQDRVLNHLGEAPNQDLTYGLQQRVQKRLGEKFNEFAENVGDVRITDDAFAALDDVLERATSESKGTVKNIVDDVRTMTARNGGTLSGKDWQKLRQQIDKLEEDGIRQGLQEKWGDAEKLMDILEEQMQASLSADDLADFQKTRYQYSVLKTLQKGASLKDGKINMNSFVNNLARRAGAVSNMGVDSLLREGEAIRYLNRRAPNSGTINNLTAREKFLANPAGAAGAVKNVARGLGAPIP